ncbi:winged helix-turn-helix transcriptional regulator [Dyadobacter frigoris]|uniref:winged helix-turn-helix transcriptional regulator n=1 Tax=Dyadobacter frigoris TaxID=2576211 RepID=UPI00148570A1|nr:helix-turn-helix domain-containing protein [Dyadobacter frigoris]
MEAKEEIIPERLSHSDCSKSLLPVRDALDALNGKWKLQIIISLMFGNKRFTQIAREIPNITDKMLSKELRDLEAHELVKRTVYDSIPVVVEYTLTEHGRSLRELIDVLRVWGIKHRNQVMGKVQVGEALEIES